MKFLSFKLFVFLSIFFVFLLFGVANAKKSKEGKASQGYQCQLISRSDAIVQARGRVNGKVVGVKFSDRGDRSVYKVRMLVNEKRIKTVLINACR